MIVLRRAVFIFFTNDLLPISSSLKFDGIWSPHVGSSGLTFLLNKWTIIFLNKGLSCGEL